VSIKSRYDSDVLALAALDTANLDLRGGFTLLVAGLGECGFGFFFRGVFGGSLAGSDGECGEVGG